MAKKPKRTKNTYDIVEGHHIPFFCDKMQACIEIIADKSISREKKLDRAIGLTRMAGALWLLNDKEAYDKCKTTFEMIDEAYNKIS